MPEGELPERPGSALTTEQHGLSRERERRNPFTAEIAGERLPGNVSDLHLMGLNPQAKFVPIDEQTDDKIMHLN
jgi:hypothetical protein